MKLELDEDGYPTEDSLTQIRAYKGDLRTFFRELAVIWWGGHGVVETIGRDDGKRVIRILLHTWGWSGNESIIAAMEGNIMLQMMAWVESRRGGHCIYEFKRGGTI